MAPNLSPLRLQPPPVNSSKRLISTTQDLPIPFRTAIQGSNLTTTTPPTNNMAIVNAMTDFLYVFAAIALSLMVWNFLIFRLVHGYWHWPFRTRPLAHAQLPIGAIIPLMLPAPQLGQNPATPTPIATKNPKCTYQELHDGTGTSEGKCLGCGVPLCKMCGHCITKILKSSMSSDFDATAFRRYDSINVRRIQVSCSSKRCSPKARQQAPESGRCQCTLFLIDGSHHEKCRYGHHCEDCYEKVVKNLDGFDLWKGDGKAEPSKFKYYACNCGQKADHKNLAVCTLCGLNCYPYSLNGHTEIPTEVGAEGDAQQKSTELPEWTWNDGDVHYYVSGTLKQYPLTNSKIAEDP